LILKGLQWNGNWHINGWCIDIWIACACWWCGRISRWNIFAF
jgi:hypothetical protein